MSCGRARRDYLRRSGDFRRVRFESKARMRWSRAWVVDQPCCSSTPAYLRSFGVTPSCCRRAIPLCMLPSRNRCATACMVIRSTGGYPGRRPGAMRARELVPILKASNLSDSSEWFAILGWRRSGIGAGRTVSLRSALSALEKTEFCCLSTARAGAALTWACGFRCGGTMSTSCTPSAARRC